MEDERDEKPEINNEKDKMQTENVQESISKSEIPDYRSADNVSPEADVKVEQLEEVYLYICGCCP